MKMNYYQIQFMTDIMNYDLNWNEKYMSYVAVTYIMGVTLYLVIYFYLLALYKVNDGGCPGNFRYGRP